MFGYQGLQIAATKAAPIGSKVRVFHPDMDEWVTGRVTSHYFSDHNQNEAPSWGIVADLEDAHLRADGRTTKGEQCDHFKVIAKPETIEMYHHQLTDYCELGQRNFYGDGDGGYYFEAAPIEEDHIKIGTVNDFYDSDNLRFNFYDEDEWHPDDVFTYQVLPY